MLNHKTIELNRRSWDTISTQYQAHTRISTDDVHYGPLAPGECELHPLGEVAGKQVLEVGFVAENTTTNWGLNEGVTCKAEETAGLFSSTQGRP